MSKINATLIILYGFVCINLSGCQTVEPRSIHVGSTTKKTITSEKNSPKTHLTELTFQESNTFENVYALVLLGEFSLSNGNIKKALGFYTQASAKTKNSQLIHRAISLAEKLEEFGTAEKLLKRWKTLEPQSLSVLQTEIRIKFKLKRFDELEPLFINVLNLSDAQNFHWLEELIQSAPKNAQIKLIDLVVNYASKNDIVEIDIFSTKMQNFINQGSGTNWLDKKISQIKPTSELLLFRSQLFLPDRKGALNFLKQYSFLKFSLDLDAQRARWLALEGNVNKASSILKRVVKLNPKRYSDVMTLAILEYERKQFDNAQKNFKVLLNQPSYRSVAYLYLGKIARALGENDKAIERLSKVEKGGFLVDAKIELAEIVAAMNNSQASKLIFSDARLLYPIWKEQLYVAEAQFHSSNSNFLDAIHSLTKLIEIEPANVNYLYSRALNYDKTDDIFSAEKDLRKILSIKPMNTNALNALGYILADKTTRFSEALVLIGQALKQEPNSPAILDSMGWVLLKLGKLNEAIPFFERAWTMAKDHEIAAHYGEALWLVGKKKEAQKIWDAGISFNNNSIIIQSTIKRLTNL